MIRLTYARPPSVRIATSPAWELVGYARVILWGANPVVPAEHLAAWRRRLRGVHLDALFAALANPQYIPSFLVPAPVSPFGSIADELRRIGQTAPEEVLNSIDPVRTHASDAGGPADALPWNLEDPIGFRDAAVEQMRLLWDVVVAPGWDAHAAMLEREVLTRGRTLALHGARNLLDELHDDARWVGDDLVVACDAIDLVVAGTPEILIIPSIFVWPKIFVAPPDEHGSSVLFYPARGAATLLSGSDRSEPSGAPAALGDLLGQNSARILRVLGDAATTTELASRFALSASGISQHLGRLHMLGLIRRTRIGRRVYYERSPRGESLVELFDGAVL